MLLLYHSFQEPSQIAGDCSLLNPHTGNTVQRISMPPSETKPIWAFVDTIQKYKDNRKWVSKWSQCTASSIRKYSMALCSSNTNCLLEGGKYSDLGRGMDKAVAFSLNSRLSFVPFGFCKYYLFKDNNNNILISKELFRYDLKLNTKLLYISDALWFNFGI